MCLSTSALALFLTVIGAERVTTAPDRIIVHATAADAHWVAAPAAPGAPGTNPAATGDDLWCTDAPQRDRAARFDEAAK